MNNKVVTTIAVSALVLAAVSLIRREVEIQGIKQTLEVLQKVQDEIQFAKIIDHLDGED
jgi:hypothetical protein